MSYGLLGVVSSAVEVIQMSQFSMAASGRTSCIHDELGLDLGRERNRQVCGG